MDFGSSARLSTAKNLKSTRSHGGATPSPRLGGRAGEAVRAQRKALRISQETLSQLAGCGVVFVYALERGTKTGLRLDKVLDVLFVLEPQLAVEPGRARLRIHEALR